MREATLDATATPAGRGAAGLAAEAGHDLERLVERVRWSVVAVRSRGGGGSGVAWPGGLVVTNAHVVRERRAVVETAGGLRRDAVLVARDPSRDLAALRLEGDPLPAALVREGSPRVGELVLALGHPWGGAVAATMGIVAQPGAGRAVVADIRLAPGNSGGPLVDASGRVVGINAMVSGGHGIAIPSATVEAFLAEGESQPGVLGITAVVAPLPGGAGSGLLLTDIAPGSAAERAGLLPGDIITGVNGEGGPAERLFVRLRRARSGRAITLAVLRGGEARTLDVLPAAA